MDYPRHGHKNEPYPDEEGYPPRGPPFHNAPPPHHPPSYDSPPPFHNAPPPHPPSYNSPPPVTHVSHYPPPASDYPPSYNSPPPVTHVSHYPPPASDYPPSHNPNMEGGYGYSGPNHPPTPYPTTASVQHVSHDPKPHMPSFIPHHGSQNPTGADTSINNRPTVRVYSKAEPNYSLTIRDGHIILAISNPSDPFQHWFKEEKWSLKVKDEQGYPSFALVNKATGQAIKHSVGATHPVQLTHYEPNKLDESILWTESKDLGDSYRTIRMVNNIKLNVDALNGDKNHGGVRDGTQIVLWEWKKGDNQRWKIVPY